MHIINGTICFLGGGLKSWGMLRERHRETMAQE